MEESSPTTSCKCVHNVPKFKLPKLSTTLFHYSQNTLDDKKIIDGVTRSRRKGVGRETKYVCFPSLPQTTPIALINLQHHHLIFYFFWSNTRIDL